MKDKEFLQWIKDRMQHVHGEKPNVDYMLRFQEIIDNLDAPKWIAVESKLPEEAVPVLAVVDGIDYPMVLEMSWDYPSFEEAYTPYRYWHEPDLDSNAEFEPNQVTHWMSLPTLPEIGTIRNL